MFPHLDKKAVDDDELHQLLIDLIRTDLLLLNNYTYEKEQPLNIPVIVLHGDNDERVKPEQAEKWCGETRESCKVISRPGGHRYIEHDGEFLTSLIIHEISVPVTVRRFINGAL
jgi:surfactin synthase thioesterase subunit